MDIAALSMVMTQSKAQTVASIAVAKIAVDTNKKQLRSQAPSVVLIG